MVSAARSPLQGRREELDVLDRALEAVETRKQAQIVTLVGPSGIGKSRLIQDFIIKHRAGSSLLPRIYRGAARENDVSFGLFARFLRMRFGLTEGMDRDAMKAAVRAQVANVLDDRKIGDVVYFLGQFLDLPFEESPLTRALRDDPTQGKLLRRAVFKAFLEADAGTSPTCLIFDDLAYAHADSLSLLRYIIEYVQGPILLICAARTELLATAEDWARSGQQRHQVLELAPLPPEAAKSLMRALLLPAANDVGDVPEQLVDLAVAFAGGNPSLLEQMVRVYHDKGVLEEETELSDSPRWVTHLDRIETAKLPLTVEDALSSRLAALDAHERKLLELAAAMGGVFWTAGLVPLLRIAAVAPDVWQTSDDGAEEELDRIQSTLSKLVERGYIIKLADSTFPNSDQFAFQQTKECEALRGRTNPAHRRRYHAALADWMQQQEVLQGSEEGIAMLAEHRRLAGEPQRAGREYLNAGDVARSRYANTKACEYYEKGLELLGESRVARRIDALHNYGDVLLLSGRIDDAIATFREMLALAFRLNLKAKGGAAHNRIGRLHRDIGNLDEATRHLEAAMHLFRAAKDERGVASTTDDIGKLLWLKGDYRGALSSLRDGLAKRRRLGDRRSIALSLNNLGIVQQDSGEFGQALESFEQALAIRTEIGDLVGVVQTLNNLGTIAQSKHEFDKALQFLREALEVAKQIGDRNRIALVLANIGETEYRAGRAGRAIEILCQAEEQFDELGDKLGLAEVLRALGSAYLLRGDVVKARDAIGRAVDLFAMVRSKVHLGVALRTLGEITAAGGWGASHTKSAREYFARSTVIFEQAGNEVELARTYKAFGAFLLTDPEFKDDNLAREDATWMDSRAEEIFLRARQGGDTHPRPASTVPPPDPDEASGS